jgi:hypothetical protein
VPLQLKKRLHEKKEIVNVLTQHSSAEVASLVLTNSADR